MSSLYANYDVREHNYSFFSKHITSKDFVRFFWMSATHNESTPRSSKGQKLTLIHNALYFRFAYKKY